VDLFPAAIAEKRVEGGLVGPTFACLLGRQFSDLRRGDRYWYENSGPFRFSHGMLLHQAVHILALEDHKVTANIPHNAAVNIIIVMSIDRILIINIMFLQL